MILSAKDIETTVKEISHGAHTGYLVCVKTNAPDWQQAWEREATETIVDGGAAVSFPCLPPCRCCSLFKWRVCVYFRQAMPYI